MWDLWWDKVALGRFSQSSSVSPAIIVRSTNYSTITLIYHPGKMYNRPICGRSTGIYTNLGDLQRDLRGLSPTPPNKKKICVWMEGGVKNCDESLWNMFEWIWTGVAYACTHKGISVH
jgi:hypothetical protein